MSERKVHLRPNRVINLGHTQTACGKVIYATTSDIAGAVASFGSFDATVHGALVDCEKCLRSMRSSLTP